MYTLHLILYSLYFVPFFTRWLAAQEGSTMYTLQLLLRGRLSAQEAAQQLSQLRLVPADVTSDCSIRASGTELRTHALYIIQHTIHYTAHYTLYSTLYNIQHTIHCTVHSVREPPRQPTSRLGLYLYFMVYASVLYTIRLDSSQVVWTARPLRSFH